jgi:hypothetical protein
VLAVLDPAGDTAMQLHQFEEVYFGDIASQGDIQIALSQWLNGRGCSAQVAAYARNFVAVKKYSRVAQSMCLTEVLHKFEDLKL